MDSTKITTKASDQHQSQTCSKKCPVLGHGEYESTITEFPSFINGKIPRRMYSMCPKCESDIERRAKEERVMMAKQKVLGELSVANVPKRYRDARISTIVPLNAEQASILSRCKTYVEKYSGIYATGASIIFTGSPGTGKSMIACSMLPEIISIMSNVKPEPSTGPNNFTQRSYSCICRYANVYDIFAEVKSTYSKNSEESEIDIIRKYTDCGLLVIDEVGVQAGTDFESNLIFRIINKRYEDMKPTFLISNLIISDLESYIGQRTVDRFHENHGAVFVFDWGSHRK
jgi:DNA replication protein DnaC